MLRFAGVIVLLLSPGPVFAVTSTDPTQPPAASVQGVVADPTGAIVPNAEVDLVDPNGSIAGTSHSGGDGNFTISVPHAGNFTLVISEPGFETVHTPVTVAPSVSAASATTAHTFAAPLHITLPIAAVATNVRVNADTNEDLTDPEETAIHPF
jgi:Carboxypeptidase regulatory-like domain